MANEDSRSKHFGTFLMYMDICQEHAVKAKVSQHGLFSFFYPPYPHLLNSPSRGIVFLRMHIRDNDDFTCDHTQHEIPHSIAIYAVYSVVL